MNRRGSADIEHILAIVAAVVAVALLITLVVMAGSRASQAVTGMGTITVTATGSAETRTVMITISNNMGTVVYIDWAKLVYPGGRECWQVCYIRKNVGPGQTLTWTCIFSRCSMSPGREYAVKIRYVVNGQEGYAMATFTAS